MNLAAEKRTLVGKNNNNRLRNSGMIPAVVYSHGKSENIQVLQKSFNELFKGHISESQIIQIDLQGESLDVFVKDYQKNPVTDAIEHLDFFKVTKGETIRTKIELHTVGVAPGVKAGGIFELLERELSIEILPRDLKPTLDVDISGLQIGDSLHIKDLKGPESMVFLADPDHVVAHCIGARAELSLDTETAAAVAGEEGETAGE
ncbi:MAG: 50S ribosomal protein L25 [Spirochaetes bacterium]|nr:50S ribosomal protein L25 [Spirochaetota bacterium]